MKGQPHATWQNAKFPKAASEILRYPGRRLSNPAEHLWRGLFSSETSLPRDARAVCDINDELINT